MDLDADLEVTVAGEGVTVVYQVANLDTEPITLSFRSGKRYEMEVFTEGADDPIWRASDDRMYPMVIGTETIDPGDRLQYEEQLTDLSPGQYTVRASLESTEATAEMSSSFTVD